MFSQAEYLSPRESAKYVVSHSGGDVEIPTSGVQSVAEMILDAVRSGDIRGSDFNAHDMHPKTGDRAAVQWIFFMDTINFSFWTEANAKFSVTYHGKKYSGYFGACACVNRAIDYGIPITDAEFMRDITTEDVRRIFTGDNGVVVPMVDERVKAISDAGRVLLEKFDGSFYSCLEQCDKSAMKLLSMIVDNFESFRDTAVYKGQKVAFFKRAQILVADIYGCLARKDDVADFADIGELTMFADYRVPQALAFLGALKYSERLTELLRGSTVLENGSETEVELRAFSIKACDDIVDAVKRMRVEADSQLRKVTAVDVDMFLWVYRRANAIEIEKAVPYHRVRCIYY